jgi:hypothetical protein
VDDYNEYDDYGMDSAEGGKEHEAAADAAADTATRLLIEERQNRNTGMLAAALLSAVMPAPLVCGNCRGYDHSADECLPF